MSSTLTAVSMKRASDDALSIRRMARAAQAFLENWQRRYADSLAERAYGWNEGRSGERSASER